MLKSFTRNYEDNSTDAGFQFTFYCDICSDGFKSSFIESTTYKKRKGTKMLGQGVSLVGSLIGGRVRDIAYSAERGGNILSERFEGKSPEWQKEHENAFERAQNEAQQHFHRCHSCHQYVCDACFNEDEGLCTNWRAPPGGLRRQGAGGGHAAQHRCRRRERHGLERGNREQNHGLPVLRENRPARENSATTAAHPWNGSSARNAGEKRPDREILQQLRKQSDRCRPAVRPLPVLWDRQSARHQILRKLRHQAVTKPIHTRG